MTSAVLGKLSTLKLSDDASPEVFTTVAEVRRVGAIGATNPEVDVTNLDSTAMEYISGLPDGNTVEFEMNWLGGNTQQTALRTAQAAGSTKHFQMTWTQMSPNTVADFQLVILSFDINETTPTSAVTARVSGRITGSITWTN